MICDFNQVLTNFQDIWAIHQANVGLNFADFDDSDGNHVSQSNEQEIEDVKKDSHAENEAENSGTFD